MRVIWPAGLAGLVLAALIPSAPVSAAAVPAMVGKTIVVDPGHGGRDPGAVANGLQEKDVNLTLGMDLKAMLESRGARVVMTRTTDTALGPNTDADLQARVNAAQGAKANAFVSVHANYVADPNYTGATTYYGPSCGFRSGASISPADVGRGYSIGQRIQRALVSQTGEVDRGTRGQIFWVLGDPGIPSVLVETGFLSNAGEAGKLATPGYQQTVANAIADGITDYFNSGDQNRTPAAPSASLAPCTTPPPANEPPSVWLQTFIPAPLLAGPDPKAAQFTMLDAFSYLKLLAPARNNYLYVLNPATNGPAWVDATKVGPSGPPPVFKAFWVENFTPTGVWSGSDPAAQRFGIAPRWSFFQVIAPQDGSRLLVNVAATGGVAYVDAADVGPSGPAPGA